ncbi:glycogen debranching N-terminal domain-containing protein, partial [Nocardia cerradoensis]
LELHVEADFVDLFAVKEGRAGHHRAEVTVADGELLLHDRVDRMRGLSVSASVEPLVQPGTLTWRVVVPVGGTWQTEIIAQPTL